MLTRMDSKKGKQVRLYIYEGDEPILKRITDHTGLSDTALLSQIVSAGLSALVENGCVVPLPLTLQVVNSIAKLAVE
jgi:hypothetical protein